MKRLFSILAILFITGCMAKQVPPSHEHSTETPKTIDKYGVLKEIRSHANQITGCYEAELKQNPKLEGRILIFFEIAEDGSVSKASYLRHESTLHNQKLIACLTKHFRSWTFPRPPERSTAEVLFPFTFAIKI